MAHSCRDPITTGNYSDSDDSDIQEIAVIPPKDDAAPADPSSRGLKRRRSSPLLDPIPTYNPTPLHILELRRRSNNSDQDTGVPEYSTEPDREERSSRYNDDYEPLLGPSPSVVGRRSSITTTLESTRNMPTTTSLSRPAQLAARKRSANSANAVRPVTSALARAVAQRKSSSASGTLDAMFADQTQTRAIQPVMWSPQLPSQIESVKSEPTNSDAIQPDEVDERYTSPRKTKQRVAHKPTIPVNTNKKPRAPLGTSKKVPAVLRMKYLDLIIQEYLSSGHPENDSYQDALKEEELIAKRAANKGIYTNLVASLRKKIREKAGTSALPPDSDPKFVDGNRVVSHDEIITGRVKGTFSIERKRKTSDPSELSETELYDKLQRYIVPINVLEAYGYPFPDPDNPGQRKAPLCKDGQPQPLRAQLASSYTCERCTKVYRVDPEGLPLTTTGKCIYHPGHLWNERINRALEKRYSCCKGDQSAGGCSSNPYHVHKGELELKNYQGFVETQAKLERNPNKHGIYALDCEMCYTTYGLELTRITVINHKYDVVYESLVKPVNRILDYNTKFSGIRDGDLDDIKTSIVDVQRDLLDMFSSKTILVGHSLDSDMKALKLFHRHFIDTAQLFPHKRGLPFKRALRTLMVENLRVIIQEDAGHDSKEDASAAFRLVMWKLKTDVPAKSI